MGTNNPYGDDNAMMKNNPLMWSNMDNTVGIATAGESGQWIQVDHPSQAANTVWYSQPQPPQQWATTTTGSGTYTINAGAVDVLKEADTKRPPKRGLQGVVDVEVNRLKGL